MLKETDIISPAATKQLFLIHCFGCLSPFSTAQRPVGGNIMYAERLAVATNSHTTSTLSMEQKAHPFTN